MEEEVQETKELNPGTESAPLAVLSHGGSGSCLALRKCGVGWYVLADPCQRQMWVQIQSPSITSYGIQDPLIKHCNA